MSDWIAMAAARSLWNDDPSTAALQALYALDPLSQGVTAADVAGQLLGRPATTGEARSVGARLGRLRRHNPRLVDARAEARDGETSRTYYRLTPDGVAVARSE